MRELTINSEKFYYPLELHMYLKEHLGFPEYYGKNLSALHDCLTERSRPVTLIFQCGSFQNEEMEAYFSRVLRVCLDSAEENENIKVEYED